MTFHPANSVSLAAFVAILVGVVSALLWAVYHSYRSGKAVAGTALGLVVWLGLLSALIVSGKLASLPMNGLPFFFGSVFVTWLYLGLSSFGGKLAAAVPVAALVGFQAFRLPLELVLHAWAKQGTIPGTMTWTGQNWDILSGLLALVCAPLAGRFPLAARIANVFGLALLLNVIRVALLSSPVPFGWGVEPPLQLAFHLPYAFIAPICVGGALFGHIVLTRKLWAKA